jgi:hypothetical protein
MRMNELLNHLIDNLDTEDHAKAVRDELLGYEEAILASFAEGVDLKKAGPMGDWYSLSIGALLYYRLRYEYRHQPENRTRYAKDIFKLFSYGQALKSARGLYHMLFFADQLRMYCFLRGDMVYEAEECLDRYLAFVSANAGRDFTRTEQAFAETLARGREAGEGLGTEERMKLLEGMLFDKLLMIKDAYVSQAEAAGLDIELP